MDIKCVKCGEPWDAWGINHGDMMAWEADLFRKGAGCPCCQGEGDFEPQTISDIENGDGDPVERINAWVDAQDGNVPKWEAPADEVIETCTGCGVQLVRLVSEETYDGSKREKVYGWHAPRGSLAQKSYGHCHDADYDPANHLPGDFNWTPWDDDRHACPECQQECAECETVIAAVDSLEPGEVYSPGAAFMPAGRHHKGAALCITCYEKRCSECGEEECECNRDEEGW